jgi:hypothetical protein
MTIQDLYQNERRDVKITLTNRDTRSSWSPSAAYAEVVDSDNGTIMSERTCDISTNEVSIVIGTTVTKTPGTYYIKWRFRKGANGDVYTFYHKTLLNVLTL